MLFASTEFSELAVDLFFKGDDGFIMNSNVALSDCTHMMSDDQFIQNVKDRNFDLAIVDMFVLSMCKVLVARTLNIPFVMMSTTDQPWLEHVPVLPSFCPNIVLHFTDKMSFMQRLINIYLYYIVYVFPSFPGRIAKPLLQKYLPEVSHLDELVSQAELFIVTRDHILEWPQPTMPHVIRTPPLSIRPGKQLNMDLRQLVDTANEGVIIISFGSLVGSLPLHITKMFLSAFASLKYTVIMRYAGNLDDIAEYVSPNVNLFPDIPQQDLIAHSKCRLFITHCGSSGLHEALYHGIPMIGFPFFAEQPHNCFEIKAHGWGTVMDVQNFTAKELVQTVKHVIEDEIIRKNVRLTREILRDAAMNPRETVAYWIDHVLRFGSDHLRPHSMNMVWYEYLMLDILAVLFVAMLITVILLYNILSCVCRKAVLLRKKDKRD
jgi:glucuronosyltransferase